MSEIAAAWVTLAPSMKGFGSKVTSQIGGEVDGAGKRLGSSFGKVFGAVAGLGIGAAVGGFLKGALEEARDAEVIGARTENVIKSMGLSSDVTAEKIGKLAGAISNKTAVDDEAIQSGQNLLLTFGNVAKSAGESNGVFAQTSQLMVDMSAAMGTDMKSSALQLGKALNDPVKGMTALTRSGVSFTEAQQKQVKSLVESGNTLKAQNIILGEVKKQFGGAAAAMATPAERAKVAWGNFQEQIGTMLLPIVDKLLNTLTSKVVPAVSNFVEGIQNGTGAGGQLASAFGTLRDNLDVIVPVMGTVLAGLATYRVATLAAAAASAIQAAGTTAATGATWSLNAALRANPIGIVVTALTALGAGLVVAYKKSETFRDIVNGAFQVLQTVVVGAVKGIRQVVTTSWNAIKAVTSTAWNAIKNTVLVPVRALVALLQGDMGKARNIVGDAWTYVRNATAKAWEAVKSGVTTAASAVIDAVREIPSKITALGGRFLDAGRAIIGKFVDGLKNAGGLVADIAGNVWNAVKGMLNDAIGKINAALEFTISLPGPDITINPPNIPYLAKGGIARAGRMHVVGEKGPELFVPGVTGRVVPNHTAFGAANDASAQLEKISRQLDRLTSVSAAQGREFGREINGAVASAARRQRL